MPPPPKPTPAPAAVLVPVPEAPWERADTKHTLVDIGWVSVPPKVRHRGGEYDLLVHFHGGKDNQVGNVERAGLQAVYVSVNLGNGSSEYGSAYRVPAAWPRLLAHTTKVLTDEHKLPATGPRRVALSAWSAGFASLKEVLAQPGAMELADAVLISDGLFTSFDKNNAPDLAGYVNVVAFGRQAMRGEKLFVSTHASIPTVGYPDTTATTYALLEQLGLPRTATPGSLGPRGMRRLYEVRVGDLYVAGYEGVTAKDHIDQLRGMGEAHYRMLETRWAKVP